MKVVKIVIWVVVLGLVVWAIVTTVAKPKAATGEPIKIGYVGPLSGEAASYGEPGLRLMRLAADKINARGGVNGQPIEVVAEDAKCSGASAASAAQKLVNVDKVQAFSTFCSGEALSAIPVAEPAKVLVFSPGASSPDLTGKSIFFFRNYPSDATQGQVLASYAVSKGWKKVAVIQEQSDYALGNFKAFDENFAKSGGITVKEEFAPSTKDFRSQLAKLRDQKPDALLIDPQVGATGAVVVTQLGELGWKVPLLVVDVISSDTETVTKNATLLEGAVSAEFGVDQSNHKFQEMIAAYKAKYGEEPPYQAYAQTEYDILFLVADGLRAVGNDGAKLAVWSRTVKDWEGASGKTTINQDGDRVGGHVLKIIKNGKSEPLMQ